MKRFVAVLLATAAMAATIAVLAGTAAAKTCSYGYVHATIGGEQKCLHAGEYCARRYQRQYLHYHFTCDNYVDGEYHLKKA